MHSVYLISDLKNNNAPLYVGRSIHPYKRYEQHKRSKSEIGQIIRRRKGLTSFTILEDNIPKDTINERENYWINKVRSEKGLINIRPNHPKAFGNIVNNICTILLPNEI